MGCDSELAVIPSLGVDPLPISPLVYRTPLFLDSVGESHRKCTDVEKQFWRAVKAGRFAGFKFRRQHPVGPYFLDFYCPAGRLAVEFDGSHHGYPREQEHDRLRNQFLLEQEIRVLRFWNHQWNNNREGTLLEVWNVLQRRTGCVQVMRKAENQRYVPPKLPQISGCENADADNS